MDLEEWTQVLHSIFNISVVARISKEVVDHKLTPIMEDNLRLAAALINKITRARRIMNIKGTSRKYRDCMRCPPSDGFFGPGLCEIEEHIKKVTYQPCDGRGKDAIV